MNINRNLPEKHNQGIALPGLDHGLIPVSFNILTKSVEHVNSRTINVRHKDEVNAIINLGHPKQNRMKPT
jgi:hypothetical protein